MADSPERQKQHAADQRAVRYLQQRYSTTREQAKQRLQQFRDTQAEAARRQQVQQAVTPPPAIPKPQIESTTTNFEPKPFSLGRDSDPIPVNPNTFPPVSGIPNLSLKVYDTDGTTVLRDGPTIAVPIDEADPATTVPFAIYKVQWCDGDTPMTRFTLMSPTM